MPTETIGSDVKVPTTLGSADQENRREADKLRYDFFKHLTTLSSGSVVILVSLAEKIAQTTEARRVLAAAFVSLIICIVGSLWGMLTKAYQVHTGRALDAPDATSAAVATILAFLGLLCALVLLVVVFWLGSGI
ncbi:MAG: hypothetical protein LC667_09445 [Thioalkalivibrio sp.]|nr:hypothetical protein [Thioalkalivibrio sp.]